MYFNILRVVVQLVAISETFLSVLYASMVNGNIHIDLSLHTLNSTLTCDGWSGGASAFFSTKSMIEVIHGFECNCNGICICNQTNPCFCDLTTSASNFRYTLNISSFIISPTDRQSFVNSEPVWNLILNDSSPPNIDSGYYGVSSSAWTAFADNIYFPHISHSAYMMNYNLTTNSYTAEAQSNFSLLTEIADPCVTNNGTHIFIIGGEEPYSGQISYRNVSVFNPIYGRITQIQSLNTDRMLAQCTFVNGKIFAIGGYSKTENETLKTIEVYNHLADEWDILPINLNHGRYGGLCISTSFNNSYILCFGGYSSDISNYAIPEVIHPSTMLVSDPGFRINRSLFAHAIVPINDTYEVLFIIGGYSGDVSKEYQILNSVSYIIMSSTDLILIDNLSFSSKNDSVFLSFNSTSNIFMPTSFPPTFAPVDGSTIVINSEYRDDSFIKIDKTMALIILVVAGVVCTAVIAGCCICGYWHYVKYLQNKYVNAKFSIQTVPVHSFKHQAIASASFNVQHIADNPEKHIIVNRIGKPEDEAAGDVGVAFNAFDMQIKRIIDANNMAALQIEGKPLSFSRNFEDMYENDGIPYGRTQTEITDLNTL